MSIKVSVGVIESINTVVADMIAPGDNWTMVDYAVEPPRVINCHCFPDDHVGGEVHSFSSGEIDVDLADPKIDDPTLLLRTPADARILSGGKHERRVVLASGRAARIIFTHVDTPKPGKKYYSP